MNSLPLHPAVVHLPLGVAMVLPLVAAALAVAVWKGKLPRAALALVAGLQLVVAAGGFAAMALGHREEKMASTVAPHDAIEEHEEAAETFVWVAVGVLVLSITPLVFPARRAPALAALVTAGTLVVAGLGIHAGEEGGKLVFHHGAGVSATRGAAPAAPDGGEHEDHDKD